jgi:uncharacterized membrane protein (UPF0127 family)
MEVQRSKGVPPVRRMAPHRVKIAAPLAFGLAIFIAYGLHGMGLPAWPTAPAEAAETGQQFENSQVSIEADNQEFIFKVELAVTPAQRRQGLMFRKSLPPDHGMLFDFGRSSPVSMWMRNTYVALDMLFIDEEGRIVNIAADTVPESEAIVSSDGPVRAVLEIPAGTSRLLGIRPGHIVRHPLLEAAGS